VAIKMMRHDMATNDEFLDSFHREAKTIASLNHDNIIRVYDIEERYRTVFIIEELVDGISLEGCGFPGFIADCMDWHLLAPWAK